MKQNFFVLVFFILQLNFVIAQNHVVIDNSTKEPIPFVVIKYNDTGFYTNEFGVFTIPKDAQGELNILHLSYIVRKININNVTDTIFLDPKILELNEVVLTQKTSKPILLKPSKTTRFFGSCILSPKTEIITFIYPEEEIINTYLDKIKIPFTKFYEKGSTKNAYAFIKLNVYSLNNETIDEVLFTSEPFKIKALKKDELEIEINNTTCKLTKEGFAIGVELIDYYIDGKLIKDENKYLRLQLTAKENKFYKANAIVKYTFINGNDIYPLFKQFEHSSYSKEPIIRNPSFGFILYRDEN